MKTANERLAEAREALGFHSKADFAKHVGIERSTYDKMEKGPHKPSADNLERIIERQPYLSLNWLLTGQGEMMLDRGMPVITNTGIFMSPEATAAHEARHGRQLTSGPATVAEAENVLLRQQLAGMEKQIAEKEKLIDRLWNMIPAKLGKMLSSLEAAGVFAGADQQVGAMQAA